MALLSRVELDYLTAKRQFGTDYAYSIKSRLQKKLQQFASQELPILVEKGYLTEFCKLTENCKVSKDLVGVEGGEALYHQDVNIMFEREANTERGSPSLVGRGIANPMSERTRGFEIS
jgi:hypothetical protein